MSSSSYRRLVTHRDESIRITAPTLLREFSFRSSASSPAAAAARAATEPPHARDGECDAEREKDGFRGLQVLVLAEKDEPAHDAKDDPEGLEDRDDVERAEDAQRHVEPADLEVDRGAEQEHDRVGRDVAQDCPGVTSREIDEKLRVRYVGSGAS